MTEPIMKLLNGGHLEGHFAARFAASVDELLGPLLNHH